MDIAHKKILVIGGAGFIGSFVVKELLNNDVGEVVIYDNFVRGRRKYLEDSLKDPRCMVFPLGGDIRDTDILDAAMADVDCVFHLAAMWLLHCNDFPRTAFDVNIHGTFNVLDACVRNNVKKLIYSSSASVYGDAVEVPMTEDHPFRNRNFYGATKIAGEAMCAAYHDRFGISIVGLRYMNVYGPHQDQFAAYSGVIPIVLNKVDQNASPTVNGDGSQAYDFIYVEDIARANICAVRAEIVCGFYNVGTGIQTSIRELCETILRLRKSTLQVQYRPYSADDSRRLVQNRIGCPEKASRDLDFRYRITLEDGLKRLIQWRAADVTGE